MTARELDRLKVVREVLGGRLKQKEAAAQLGVSTRQVRKVCRRVRREGNKGIIHGLRGKRSNHRLAKGLLDRAIRTVQTRYADFGPTLANEKLAELHGIELSTSVLRQGMMQASLWKTHKAKTRHRAWRERRACLGELVQLDGSTHAWFEKRAAECVLIAYIDDATGRVQYAEFAETEATLTLMKTTGTYLRCHGRPVAFYVDKDSIYKVNRQASIDEELRDSQATTQFARAMKELDILMINAHSPQAKGRVERLFGTLQDRLVKELRLAEINTISQANEFLCHTFVPQHNKRFSVQARNSTDAHRPLRRSDKLEETLSIRVDRTLMNDYTLRHSNRWYQISAQQPVRVRPGDTISVEMRLDGTIHLRFKGCYLDHHALQVRPVAVKQPRWPAQPTATCKWKPASSHPWRRKLLPDKKASAAARDDRVDKSVSLAPV